ncbi:MAG TPA: FHA domain-containing protein [Acidimicrobiia bacterium]|nr:FHA domain-containing protein [Actinomycetota bacterium]HIG25157.1 FHA domain-containing protein [Acidimicrobiia bacterium]MBT3746410.1 FHA domain-containing protein [Actinomycetota bacterium]MBT3968855.1 FHA domain-containing protein [Actinomycetota bacterium]MBT4009528.1 FHA domain-containing protein [Actinomycetota bacterium]
MSDELLTILRLCLLGLCYLFFFRVLRAVWVETRAPKTTTVSLNSSQRLVITAPKQNAGRSYDLADEITLGRAAGCTITVDDDFVSQMHARVFQRADQIVVEDLGSTNGTYVNRQRVSAPMVMRLGDQLQVGDTVLELT